MNKKVFFGLLLFLSTVALHLDPENQTLKLYRFYNNHQQTNTTQIKNQNISSSELTEIQSLSNFIDNQLNALQSTYNQLQKIQNTLVINNSEQTIQCKNISLKSQKNIQSELQNVGVQLWNLYFKIQKLISNNITVTQLSNNYQILKKRKKDLENRNKIYCSELSKKAAVKSTSNGLKLVLNQDISQNKYISNLKAMNNWSYGSITQTQYQLKQYQFLLSNDVILCPNDKPFAANNECISCPTGQIYFLDVKSCKICPDTTIFNQKFHKCVSKSFKQCPNNQIFSLESNSCQCPLNKPYLNGQVCQQCFIPYFWNNQSKKCQSCPKGKNLNVKTSSCESCGSQSVNKPFTTSCHISCSLSTPFYNGGKCISCPQVYNLQSKTCQSCPDTLIYNRQKNICQNGFISVKNITCALDQVYNEKIKTCEKSNICPSSYVYNKVKATCECPPQLPNDTGFKCIVCNPPQFFDQNKKQCITCKGQSYFDTKTSNCIQCPAETPMLLNNKCSKCPSNSVFDKQLQTCRIITSDHYCPLTYIWSQKQKKCVCPKDKPYSTSNGCASSCPKGQIWSKKANSCVFEGDSTEFNRCKQAQIWNQQAQQCVCIPNYPYKTPEGCTQCYPPLTWSAVNQRCEYSYATTNITRVCDSGLIYNNITGNCQCPKDKPFYDNKQCLSCYLPMYWNYSRKKCQYCPKNQFFNTYIRKCQACPFMKPILVNYECSQCPVGTFYNQITQKCQKVQCFDQAVFSVQKNRCICKNSSTPFFDGKKCVSCLPPKKWDIASSQCL